MLSSACPHPQWSPSSAPHILHLAEGTWRKCLRNPCWCSVYACVSHSPDGSVFPQAGHIQGFNAVLCILYRPRFNNGGLTSGPKTRISAAGQEALSLWFWGLSPQYLAASGDHDSVQCPTVSCSRGEACVFSGGAHCAPLCLPFGTPATSPISPPLTHSLRHAAALPAPAKNISSWLHSNVFGFLYFSFSSHKTA